MRRLQLLSAVVVPVLFSSCDGLVAPAPSRQDSSVTGAARGSIASSFQAALRGTWSFGLDSIRIVLRRGETIRTLSGSLAEPLRADDLQTGRWTAEIAIHPSRTRIDDSVAYGMWALDTIEVAAGGTVSLDPSLISARFRTSTLEPDTLLPSGTRRPGSLAGTWHIRHWVGPDSLVTGTSLTLFRSGALVGFDGRDSFPGTWGLDSSELLSILPVFEHPWPEWDPPISLGAAEGLLSLSGVRAHATADSLVLELDDSLRAVFTREPGDFSQSIHPRP